MLRILHRSSDPCFQCGKTDDTALVKGPNFQLVLCMAHTWLHIPGPDAREKRKDLPGQQKLVDT